MDLLEHQAKQLFREVGVPLPIGILSTTSAEAVSAASTLGFPVAVKAQIPFGGRGKEGGVRVVRSSEEAKAAATDILGSAIKGFEVGSVLVESGVEIAEEYYLAILVDRGEKAPRVVFSEQGGVDIESLALSHPNKIRSVALDVFIGLRPYHIHRLLDPVGLAGLTSQVYKIASRLYELFESRDCLLVEVNPLVKTKAGAIVALDAKVTIDDNAKYRQHGIGVFEEELRTPKAELTASELGLNYIHLEGDIGIVGNGAGLVMATLDLVTAAGGDPANFLDVGGGASADQVSGGLRIVLDEPGVKAVLINIFGGITRCEEVAQGIADVVSERGGSLPVPVVVRLAGNGAVEGLKMIEPLPIEAKPTLEEAARRVVEVRDMGGPK